MYLVHLCFLKNHEQFYNYSILFTCSVIIRTLNHFIFACSLFYNFCHSPYITGDLFAVQLYTATDNKECFMIIWENYLFTSLNYNF